MHKLILKTDANPALLIIRLALGIVMFPHGAQKMFGWFNGPGFSQSVDIFAGMGFPVWSTVMLILVECVGSVLLIAGFLTRIWAFGIGAALTICMFMNHVKHGFFMNWFGLQQGEGFEFHLLAVGIALALVIRGGGFFSIDRALIGNDTKYHFPD